MGSASHPVIPPALIADIAGGSYPAVMNILLALRERDHTGRGRHLDVSMTDNLFTLMYWAIGQGLVSGEWPRNGTALLTGASPRYRLYATKDGRMLAVGALEQKFWDTFCAVINLDPGLRDDAVDPTAKASRITEIVASEKRHGHAESTDAIVAFRSCRRGAGDERPHCPPRVFDYLIRDENGQTPGNAGPVDRIRIPRIAV
jgi:crotonobetainyl-CoA:carnitine CoA-transferase CaiB-like acyl-CoA transferase